MPIDPLRTDRDVWQTFRHHSRTFSFAARLLPRPVRLPIATLYLLCRSVDSIADHRVLQVGPARALAELEALHRDLDATLAGRPPEAALWQRLHQVHRHFPLRAEPLYELIEGARWDLEGRRVETLDDLLAYSNLVGGSVGAMLLPFLLDGRAASRRAETPARALGIAMQITNILRDVGEDYTRLDRVYLPRTWMAEASLAPHDLDRPAIPETYPALVERVMVEAETLYEVGLSGLDLLPARMRRGIRAAARGYREILNEIRALGYDNLNRRAFVPLRRKCALVVRDGYEDRRSRLHRPPAWVSV